MKSALAAGMFGMLLAACTCSAQQESKLPEDTLAVVGSETVTARDLVERMELMPWPEKERVGDRDSAKIKALQSLVAERILASEAASRGLGDDSVTHAHEQSLEKLLVRDELYKRVVQKKVRVTQAEIREGLVRFASRPRILMILTRDKGLAEDFSRLLRRSGNRDSVLSDFRRNAAISIDSVTVYFGLLEKEQEDVVYGLTTGAPTSKPVELRRGAWAVLLLFGRETDPVYSRLSLTERTDEVRKRIRKRKEIVLAGQAAGRILDRQRAEAKEGPFSLLKRTLYTLLSADSAALRTDRGYRLDMVVDEAESELGPHLHDLLVEMPGNNMSIGDVLEALRTAELFVPSLDPEDFPRRLNAGVKEMVERELLAREGYRLGLEYTEDVRHDVSTWVRYWRATAMSASLLRGIRVSDEDVIEYLVSHPGLVGATCRVNIREILTDSLREALDEMNRISEGENMERVARESSRREGWAQRGGESGFFSVTALPEIGIRALFADTGRLLGPVHVPNGYSIFTVLAKEYPGGKSARIDSVKAAIETELLSEKERLTLEAFISSVARDYRVTLYYNRLKDVEISPVNLVTERLIGFGGVILAVPALNPLWKWVRESKAVKEVLP
jgi:hypothetical protein